MSGEKDKKFKSNFISTYKFIFITPSTWHPAYNCYKFVIQTWQTTRNIIGKRLDKHYQKKKRNVYINYIHNQYKLFPRLSIFLEIKFNYMHKWVIESYLKNFTNFMNFLSEGRTDHHHAIIAQMHAYKYRFCPYIHIYMQLYLRIISTWNTINTIKYIKR